MDVRVTNRGFTLTELIVVFAIVGVLASLLLPAVQGSREAVRRLSCMNNARQIILAVHMFENAHGHYPLSYFGYSQDGQGREAFHNLSAAGSLAGFLGEAAIAGQIAEAGTPTIGHGLDWAEWGHLPVDAPQVLRCPADGAAVAQAKSYRFCHGLLPTNQNEHGNVFGRAQLMRPADVFDGLSQTIFISERLIARGTDPRVRPNPLYVSEGLDLVDECIRLNQAGEMMDAPGGIPSPTGSRWLAGSAVHDGYYHLFPPNSDWKDCVKSLGQGGVISARSNHPQSVVVAFGDGAVRPVANAVDQTIWRAWSTRAGGEVIAVE